MDEQQAQEHRWTPAQRESRQRIEAARRGLPYVNAHPALYSKDNLRPAFAAADWRTYRKAHLTRAVRIIGPFEVQTKEGPLKCEDGYLAVDAAGWPYPIAFDDFEQMYEEVVL